MESFKANLIIFIFILVVGGLGYWAVTGIKVKTDSFVSENLKEEDVKPVVVSQPELNNNEDSNIESVANNEQEESQEITDSNSKPEEPQNNSSNENTTNDSDSALISDLQDLIDDKILMKKGSKGTRVGTVQKFLIRYGISMKVDNDYGDTTVNAVKKFQTEQKISADGQTGEGTYQKMIDWLKNN